MWRIAIAILLLAAPALADEFTPDQRVSLLLAGVLEESKINTYDDIYPGDTLPPMRGVRLRLRFPASPEFSLHLDGTYLNGSTSNRESRTSYTDIHFELGFILYFGKQVKK